MLQECHVLDYVIITEKQFFIISPQNNIWLSTELLQQLTGMVQKTIHVYKQTYDSNNED